MRNIFDPAFDRSVWRGDAANAQPATAGEAGTGPVGLPVIQDTQLGLDGPSFPGVCV